MRHLRDLALAFCLSFAAAPAVAQYAPGGGIGGGPAEAGGGATAIGGGTPSLKPQVPDAAPPGLPGAGLAGTVPTGPSLSAPNTGDPTLELFTAINKGDDAAAQDALSRGADLNAKNQFGETPLDLSIALNRTSITFLLLQTRNELAAQDEAAGPLGQPWMLPPAKAKK